MIWINIVQLDAAHVYATLIGCIITVNSCC